MSKDKAGKSETAEVEALFNVSFNDWNDETQTAVLRAEEAQALWETLGDALGQ